VDASPYTAIVDDIWLINGITVSENNQLLPMPNGGTLDGFIQEAFPAGPLPSNPVMLEEIVDLTLAVPEPACVGLFGVGAVVLGVCRAGTHVRRK
jgi:hypothetical protein